MQQQDTLRTREGLSSRVDYLKRLTNLQTPAQTKQRSHEETPIRKTRLESTIRMEFRSTGNYKRSYYQKEIDKLLNAYDLPKLSPFNFIHLQL